MRWLLMPLLVLSVLAADSARAIRVEDSVSITPIIGRFPGVGSTQWQTDIFIANPYGDVAVVELKFYAASGLRTATITIGPYGNATFRDIVLNTFGLSNAGGPLEASTATSRIEVRARIYNIGNPAGQFGQAVPGIGKSQLGRQSFIQGLSISDSTRTNIGVTNPNDATVAASLLIRDHNGDSIAEGFYTVPPHSNVQINDIAAAFGIPPQDGLQIQFNTASNEVPIYGYASEVRNDTGDAIFIFGTAPNTGP